MKGKLITNGILSLLTLLGTILSIIWIIQETKSTTMSDGYGHLIILVVGLPMSIMSRIASLVMGIITLATKSNAGDKRGITTASGVLGILGGLYGVNAIVSFIAAKGA